MSNAANPFLSGTPYQQTVAEQPQPVATMPEAIQQPIESQIQNTEPQPQAFDMTALQPTAEMPMVNSGMPTAEMPMVNPVQSFNANSFNGQAQMASTNPMISQTTPTPVMSIQEQIAAMQPAQPAQPVHKAQEPKKEKSEAPVQQQQVIAPIIAPPPQLEDGQTIICQLSPGMFDSFIKVLSLLDSGNIINIEDSMIMQLINNNTAILKTNIMQLCGNKSINLHILQPKTNIKLFKAIKDNNDVFFIDDSRNKRFQVICGDVRIWLPKKIEDTEQSIATPKFVQDQFIGETITISKEERSKITTLMSDQSSITLLFKDNQLKGYLIPEKVEASFKQFPGEKISENNAELKLVSSSFLSIPSDGDTQISIAYQNGVHWMLSKINTAMVEIFIIESLQLMQNNQLLL